MIDFSFMKRDCFAFEIGKNRPNCNILSEMICQKRECSFYKTMEQYIKDQKKYPCLYTNFDIKCRVKPKKEGFEDQ